ncbi:MAG: hypothetical protein JST19_03145 [Bacteroidetes bacterium]|nr:hypothetical protein [Bacteroidota bacterium]
MKIKLYKSKLKAIRLILLSLPFVIVCLYFLLNNDADRTMDWFCLCFFGLGIPLGIYNLLDNRPQIIIDQKGIFDRMVYRDVVDWNLINDAYYKELNTSRFNSQKFICLSVDKNAPILLKANKRIMQFSESLGFEGLNLPISELKDVNGEKLALLIKTMAHADASAKQNLLLTFKL